jgi:hypothetical protein
MEARSACAGVEEYMDPRHFIGLRDPDRALQPAYYFMVNCLLYSRMEVGIPSNEDGFDEDVNVYIANLLESFMDPGYVDKCRRFLSKYDTEIFARLSASKDARLKYTIYKTNADFLLISIGIFDNPRAGVTPSRPAKMDPSEEAYMGRGKTYYQFAYSYSQVLHGKDSAISDVLEKLSTGFDKYIQILTYMRGEYLDLVRRLSSGEVYHLERIVNEEKRNYEIRQKQDGLLDFYSKWMRNPSVELEAEIRKKVSEIKEMEPSFNFPWPPQMPGL